MRIGRAESLVISRYKILDTQRVGSQYTMHQCKTIQLQFHDSLPCVATVTLQKCM